MMNRRRKKMSDKESKFTKEYILRAFNAAVFLDEPACTEMREALNEMMGLKARIATLEAQLRWIPVSEGNLPAINVKVEVKCAGGGVAIGRTTLQSTAKFPFFYFFDVYDIESEWNERIWTAVAWRPIPELPNPPEEVSNE
jgi:hypothetical protein